jgi:hypothetical protein
MCKWVVFKRSTNSHKHMKCSTSLVIKEMQMKITLRFHFSLVRMAITNNTNNNKCCWRWGAGGRNHHTLLVECKLVQSLWKPERRFLRTLTIELLFMILLYHSCVHTWQRVSQHTIKTPVHSYLLQHYSQ